jgi:hypothetical protein
VTPPAEDRAAAFRRLYADVRITGQLAYYRDRQREYERAHRQAVVLRSGLLLLAALAGGAGPFVPVGARAALGVAAAVLAALAAAVTAYAALIGFPQLEKLYGDAARNLDEALLDWHALPPGADVAPEVARVEDVFRSERGQWGQLVVKSAPTPPSAPAPPPRPA